MATEWCCWTDYAVKTSKCVHNLSGISLQTWSIKIKRFKCSTQVALMNSHVWPVFRKCDCAHILPAVHITWLCCSRWKNNFPDNLSWMCRSSGERNCWPMLLQEAEKRCLVDLNWHLLMARFIFQWALRQRRCAYMPPPQWAELLLMITTC